MPCYDSGPRDTGVSYSEFNEVRDRLDLVTSLLCELTKDMKIEDISNPKLKKWVKAHREADKKLKNGETLREFFNDTYKDKLK